MSEERTPADIERDDVRQRFAFHPSTFATGPKHDEVRAQHRSLALWILGAIPPSRERSLALTALQEAMMWCNAGVAIYTESEPLRAGARDEA